MTGKIYEDIDINKPVTEIDKEILDYWKNNNIINEALNTKRDLKKFVFLEGPPTANGRPHVGHLMTRTMKDTVMRYKFMDGYDILRRTGGWDCHGLPVELEAEKHFGFNSKKEIEDFGIQKFNEYCRESVFRYIDEWHEVDDLIGFWIDQNKSYITLKNDYIESEWWALKTLYESKMLVKDYKIVPYCPRCGTSLSSHEVAQGYKNVDDPSVYVKFRERGYENRFFIAWTTTPWTLPSNEFLVVNPDFDYSLISSQGEEYYLLSSMVDTLFKDYKIIKTFKGRDLDGIRYEQLMPFLHVPDNALRVVTGDFVTAEDGTGIVHAAPAFGADDFEIAKRENVSMVNPVSLDGKFVDDLPWKDMFFENANIPIIDYLKKNKILFKSQKIKHTYPFCYRCGTRLMYYPLDAWFIKVSEIRNLLMENNEKINWFPDYLKDGRFGNFLAEAKDWALSRDRYWGTPLPVWKCKNGHYVAVGSREELKALGGNVPEDLHRPFIDDVVLKCPQCSEPMHREPHVIDTWFDSGSAPYAALHYPFNKEFNSETSIPVDFITEAIDQTRGWFYTQHVISSLLFKKNAYKNVLSIAFILDEHGQKMSKSKGNFVTARQFIDDFGADPARLFFFSGAPWNSKSIDRKLIGDLTRKSLGTLGNIYSFFASNANLDNFVFERLEKSENILDMWLLSRLNSTIKSVRINMDSFNMHIALKNIMDLIDDFSNFYLRLSRKNFWEGELSEDKKRSYETLYFTLLSIIKMLAPMAPFYSEYLYQKLSGEKKSVHFEDYPVADTSYINEDLEKTFKYAETVLELSRRARQDAGIKGRQTVKEILIYSDVNLPEDVLNIISPELNAESIRLINQKDRPVKVVMKPVYARVAPVMRSKTSEFSDFVLKNSEKIYKEIMDKGYTEYNDLQFKKEDFEINEIPDENYSFASADKLGLNVFINRHIDEKLKLIGYAREIIRRIQIMRKDMNLEYSEFINTSIDCTGDIKEAVEEYSDYIKKETLSRDIKFGSGDDYRVWDIDGGHIGIKIETIN
ncbi:MULTISPECIES: isoleucine--tRNA ligase [unclassified Acidiplasma]|uniref:isoleucine--tRNA ligase n=1 Tax=unclassified Acidiplasma TaxID=2641301 RepID=UPI0005EA3B31|nr:MULTISPECIES: isoleucine--tRNA ligase [unclassified Acidiplasma]KJE48822.1 isoleucyl-tRNA synthetase [Acidiplasma sp. MBA-1]WMT54213.1 MAG: isoleucine--tRNA ligase [Acidiplasma sp.]